MNGVIEVVYIPPRMMAMRNAFNTIFKPVRDGKMSELLAKLP